jgi:hypothetical protein
LKRRRLRKPASDATSIIGSLVSSNSRFARCTRMVLAIWPGLVEEPGEVSRADTETGRKRFD